MNLFEKAQLKGQKLNLATLTSKPESKQQYLAPIRSLDADDQADLLSKVIGGELSLGELKTQAQERKQIKLLRTAFVKLTNCESWVEAQDRFPQYASSAKLRQYLHIDLKKALPQTFIEFCTRAKSVGSSEATVCVRHGTVSAIVLEGKINELSSQTLRSVMPTFSGASLIIATLDDDVSACKMKYKHVLSILIMISINTGLYTRTCGVTGLQH